LGPHDRVAYVPHNPATCPTCIRLAREEAAMSYPFPFERKPSSFPNAFVRTFAPKVLQVVHVTGNSDVAALPDGLTPGHSPYQDWLYAARNPQSEDGPSAHNYVGRKGSTIEMWDPANYAAWSNGDLKSPNLSLRGVKYLADLRAKGTNANRGVYREIELSGYPGSFDPTDDQIEVAAYFAAVDSIATGLPIVRGDTILTHADINSVDRANCAFRPAIREARLALLCKWGDEIKADLEIGDKMGLHVTYPPGPIVAGMLAISKGTDSIRVADGEHYTVPIDTRKPATFVALTGPNSGAGYQVDLNGDEAHFIRVAEPVAFTPTPALDCTEQLADAVAAEHERTRTAAIKAVEAIA